MIIRRAKPDDKPALLRLAQDFATSFAVEQAAFERSFDALLTHPEAFLAVAEVNGEAAGYVLGFDHLTFFANGRAAWIEEIVVSQTFRRQGAGRKLTEAFEAWPQSAKSKSSPWQPGVLRIFTRRWVTKSQPCISASGCKNRRYTQKMADAKPLVSERRRYLVTTVAQAKEITVNWLTEIELNHVVSLGLPEVDDRYHLWRVPLLRQLDDARIGELAIDAYTTAVLHEKSTKPEMLEARLLKKDEARAEKKRTTGIKYPISTLRNTVGMGDCVQLLDEMPAASVDLIFTSPPYFNARPEYSDYEQYEQYLFKMRQVIKRAHGVLNEGRFFVMNTAPVLLRRASRSEASRRIAVPFDLHQIFIEEGFDFIGDIIWAKPEGAEAVSEGYPSQHETMQIAKHLLVFRRRTDLSIDWHIRNHPNQDLVAASKIGDDCKLSHLWHDAAASPLKVARAVISNYSFRGDVVLDPFAGVGTVGKAAAGLGRGFALMEANLEKFTVLEREAQGWLTPGADEVLVWSKPIDFCFG